MRYLAVILWLVSTSLPAGAYETELVVARDGSGDYASIQAAIDAAKGFPWDDITIYIKAGVYEEKVNVYAWNTRLRLIGEGIDKTVIRFGDYFDKMAKGRNSTFHTYTMRVAGNDFVAKDLSIENTAGPVGQAVALHVEADRAAFFNVAVRGHQDTLYVAGEGHRSYFENCEISGTVDFIFGEGTAYFHSCDIQSLRSDSYITAASTPVSQTFGLVFDQCRFTALAEVSGVYLGRPWRRHARTVIVNSELGAHIRAEGWHDWDDPQKQSTAFYAEANNRGPGAVTTKRVPWVRDIDPPNYVSVKVLRDWQPTVDK